jgi:hypothetical protein
MRFYEKSIIKMLQKHITQPIHTQFYINTPLEIVDETGAEFRRVDGYVCISDTHHLVIEILEDHHAGKKQSMIDIDRRLEILMSMHQLFPHVKIDFFEIWVDQFSRSKSDQIDYIRKLKEYCSVKEPEYMI